MGTKCSQQDVWDGKSQSWARTCSQGWATSTSQDPAPGVLGCHGVWMAFGSHAEPPSCPGGQGLSGVSPHHPGGSSGRAPSPPCWRQRLAWTLFWMFMGFQFTPGPEAAKLPSQGGVIPRGRPAAWPPVEGGPALGPSPCAVGGSSACPSQPQKIWSK